MKKLWVIILSLLFFSSCEAILYVKEKFASPSVRNSAAEISVSSFPNDQRVLPKASAVQNPTIILMKGNNLVRGFPCFGENAIEAIYGEYKIEIPDDSIIPSDNAFPLLVNSWLTSEFMYIDPDLWKARTALQNFRAREMQNEDGLYIVLGFPNTIVGQEKWTILFHIPRETIDAGIHDTMINRMIQNWTSRLSYYISISSQNGSQLSLPAITVF